MQQESISVTYSAGISNACVINTGATKTSTVIIKEGVVVPDMRIWLNMGRDNIRLFLFVLLEHIHFPYWDAPAIEY